MQRFMLRFVLIVGISYASLLGGVIEHVPLIRIGHQVIATVILGAWLLNLWRSGRAFPATPLDAPLLAAGGFWVIAALFSRDPRTSLEYTWPIWVHILFFYLCVDLMRRSITTQRWIMEGIFITGALVVLITAFEMVAWYFGLGIPPQFSQSWPDLFGLKIPPVIHEAAMALNYNNPTAAYCLLVIPLALAGSLTVPQRDLRWGLRGIAGGLVLVVLATQSRGGYLGLAILTGMIALLWLLRPDTRAHFPAILRPLLAPRLLIPAAIATVIIGGGIGLWVFAIHPAHPSNQDVSRVDLWFSAVELFKDHPITGVGPRQFASNRLWHSHWRLSYSYLPLQHAHGLYFNWLAEGGTLGIAVGLWLVVRLGRIWWRKWQSADAVRRRRLEGVLAGLVAFAAHNLVDTFLQTQLMTPVIIMVAYTVAGGSPYDAHNAQPESLPRFRRRLVVAGLAALAIVQIAFLPIHRALWAHHQTLNALAGDDLTAALDYNRTAQRFDPWQDLYALQEATILGRLAADHPGAYLDQAITAYEDALNRNESWAQGWFNLSALYAEAGRYDDAIDAVQTAITWDSEPARYRFRLGEYALAAGDEARAYEAFTEALRGMPAIASSDIWNDPSHAVILEAIRADVAGTGLAFDLAMYRDDHDTARLVAHPPDDRTLTSGLRYRRDVLWPDGSATPCPTCFSAAGTAADPDVEYYLLWAERLLLDNTQSAPDDLTAEKAARAALFLDEGGAGWGWYVLARLAERGDLAASVGQIDTWLARSVSLPGNYNFRFSTTVYGLSADLDILPQAHTPRISSQLYEPWLLLADRHESRAEWDDARSIYKLLLDFAPYDQVIQARLDALPPESDDFE